MGRFLVYILLRNHPDAIAKIMLLVKQGRLGLESASFTTTDGGERLSAILTLKGPINKAEWLTRKLQNFPYFYQAYLLPLTESEK